MLQITTMETLLESGVVYFMSSMLLGMCCKHIRRCSTAFCSQNSSSEREIPYNAYQDTKTSVKDGHVPFIVERMDTIDARARAKNFLALQNQRRSVRFFSSDPVPLDILLTCIETAGTAPSGAHQQPWHFCVVQSTKIKRAIRDIVEREEQVGGVSMSHQSIV